MKSIFDKTIPIKQRLALLYCKTFNYVRGFFIIFMSLLVGDLISKLLPITIPGSIIGLLLLFFLLAFQIIPTHWIKDSCGIFMRYMAILFIPAALGIMDKYQDLIENSLPIIVSSIASTFIVMLLVGVLTSILQKPAMHKKHQIKTEE